MSGRLHLCPACGGTTRRKIIYFKVQGTVDARCQNCTDHQYQPQQLECDDFTPQRAGDYELQDWPQPEGEVVHQATFPWVEGQ